MLEAQSNYRVSEGAKLIVVWATSDGARCMLVIRDGVLELRLENNGEAIRRAHYIDIRPACDTAQQWRIDWDIESRGRRVPNSRIICPECGDDGLSEKDAESGIHWFRCASCGEVWFDDTPRL
jgi:hypothetical protein